MVKIETFVTNLEKLLDMPVPKITVENVGTGEKYVKAIEEEGLLPKGRLYVHLSSDPETARKVGNRHGRPVIFRILAGQMQQDGYEFFLSENGVWLTKNVPVGYLKREA